MKKQVLFLVAIAFVSAMTLSAQRRFDFEKMHKERVEKRAKDQAKELKLDKETSLWFTNLYIEYQEQLRAVRKEAMKDMPKPSKPEKNDDDDDDSPENVKEKEMKKFTDEQAEKFILGGFDVAEKEVAVKRDYYNRFREKLTPKQLLRIFSQRRGGLRGGNGRQGRRPMGGQGGFPPMGGPGGFPPMGGN